MAQSQDKTPTIDGLETVFGVIGITFGVIPLARWFIQGEHGEIFAWLFGDPSGAMGYLAPLVVVAASILIIAALEISKRRA